MVCGPRLGGIASNAGDRVGVFGVSERGVVKQRADGCQPRVAGGGAVGTVVLEVVQERGDQLGVEIVDVQLAGRLAGLLLGERE
jgi:hypothetical protein